MAETVDPAIARPRYEIRPSALQTPNAPEEFVDNEAKPLTFGDMLDAINPLQQLPIIGSIYRAVTGTSIAPAARVVGGVLFGGLTGGISAIANAVVEGISGKDISAHLIAMATPGEDAPPAPPGTPAGDPQGDHGDATLQFASYRQPTEETRGSIERNGLLTTWIPGAAPGMPAPRGGDPDMRLASAAPPGGISVASLSPSMLPSAVPPVAAAREPAIAQIQAPAPAPVPEAPTAAAAPAPAPTPAPEPMLASASAAGPMGGPMRAMSLDGYRARAFNTPVQMVNMPVVDSRLGVFQRAEAARTLAVANAGAKAAAAMPAALQAQQSAEDTAGDPQSYFAASMARGLERYRQMQQQREEANRRGI